MKLKGEVMMERNERKKEDGDKRGGRIGMEEMGEKIRGNEIYLER